MIFSQLMILSIVIFLVINCAVCYVAGNHKKYYLVVLLFIVCKVSEITTPSSLAANLNVTTTIKLFDNNAVNGFSTTMARFVEVPPVKGWSCYCWNSTTEFAEEMECSCEGDALLRVPQKLQVGMNRLTITKAGLALLRSTGLKVYASSLRDVTLNDLSNFESIQPGAFDSIRHLRTIYISNAPKLTYLTKDVFYGVSDTIKTIRITNTGLVKVPDFGYLSKGTIMHMIDLEGNKIDHIERRAVSIKTEQLILDNNEITLVADSAFYGSEIGKLSFKGNTKLQYIHPRAFVGIHNIQELDLSGTSLLALPWEGLQSLEVLRVQKTHSLKTIPSIYEFKNLQVAWLTHPFHCCAFKFPSRHDPVRHAKRIKYLHDSKRACLSKSKNDKNDFDSFEKGSTEIETETILQRRSRNVAYKSFIATESVIGTFSMDTSNNTDRISFPNFNDFGSPTVESITGSSIVIINGDHHMQEDFVRNEDFGQFHEATADIETNNGLDAMCGNITEKKIDVSCFPMPDALNPCEDVMGSNWLRISVWVVVLLAVFGNIAVLVVILSNRSDFTVSKFLMSHLAFADLCMGLFLLLIASIDAHSMGEYFNYAYDWQYGPGCKVAGFLTVFASHLSVFTLTIITLERWFAITNAIYLNKRIKMKSATYIMVAGWIYSAFMSAFPLLGVSNYSSTSICLPMEARDSWDVIYLVAILGINGAAFFVIAICYAQIYFSLGKETRRAGRHTSGEMTIAKKMALLVFTNFSCWAPIGFFGLTALAGYPLINVTKSKILLVFFYPLNSCADPYLYAILTSQYRRELYVLLSRLGIFKQKAQRYKNSYSPPGTNVSYPLSSPPRNSLNSTKKCGEDNLISNEDFV